MPGVNPDPGLWFAQQLAQIRREVAALKTQTTRYVVDPTTNVCVAIIGDISHDPAGNSTGLTGWGIAVFSTSAWKKVT